MYTQPVATNRWNTQNRSLTSRAPSSLSSLAVFVSLASTATSASLSSLCASSVRPPFAFSACLACLASPASRRGAESTAESSLGTDVFPLLNTLSKDRLEL